MKQESQFPIIDGIKKYQDFTDNQVTATLENLSNTLNTLNYLEDELEQKIGWMQSEKRRMCKCIHILKSEEDALNVKREEE